MIAVIDYGIGNIQSVINACARSGHPAQRVTDAAALADLDPDRIILPGVGAIGAALSLLRQRGLEEALTDRVLEDGTPFLGICVGMQILATVCEEFGSHQGFNWIPGRIVRLPEGSTWLRVPHVGWNSVRVTQAAGALFGELDGEDFYFVHSYHMVCEAKYVATWTTYGDDFASAVRHGNIVGVQFHPEKSSQAGLKLIKRFLEETECISAA